MTSLGAFEMNLPPRLWCGVLAVCGFLGLRNFSFSLRSIDVPGTDATGWLQGSLPLNTPVANESTTVTSRPNVTLGGTKFAPRQFFILQTPEYSTWLLQNHTQDAIQFYDSTLNEEAIEIWLHRGFEELTAHRTFDESAADVFLIPFYGHFSVDIKEKTDVKEFADNLLQNRIHDKSKPHVLLCPSNNPGRSRQAGIQILMETLSDGGVNVWSVGIERNPSWQHVDVSHIIPIPYLVKPSSSSSKLRKIAEHRRISDSVFYAGDERPNAIRWAGCNRSMVAPLKTAPNMVVELFKKGAKRLTQPEYNQHMKSTEYCLILCGDTPTSRSLASSVIHGCIPVRIGSRLRGLCEKPCKKGFGWTINGPKGPHLPFVDAIPWREFPEVDEAEFIKQPEASLKRMMRLYPPDRKQQLRDILLKVQLGWIYGWGSPVTSNEFGGAAEYVWNSTLFLLGPKRRER